MNIIYVVIYIAAAIEVILGIIVLLNNRVNRINQLFAIVAAVTAIWIVSNALITLDPIEFWVKNTYATGILVAPVILIWLIRFITKKNIGFLKLFLISGSALFFSLLTYSSNLIIQHVETSLPSDFSGTFGVLFSFFASYFIFICTYILLLITRAYRNSKGIERLQYFYIAVGLYGFGIIAAIVDFILPLLGINFLIILDSPSSIIFITAMSFAILKHQLFNVKVIATEMLVFSLWIIILVRTIISDTTTDLIINSVLFLVLVVIGIFLIRSVIKEVDQREKIEKLALDLQKANDRLKEVDKQKSEFVSFATHQLRAPLTAMKGYASLILEREMEPVSEKAREAVGRIFESSNTLTAIVDDYLNVTRIELGSIRYTFDTINLKDLVENVIAELKPNIDKSVNIKFSVNIEKSSDYLITADKDKLKQVIANLVDNSVKYTPKGKVVVSLSYDTLGHIYVFKVSDTGIGISSQILPKLFQKWSRSDNANKTNIKGTGLGLYVAKEIINAHHGTIRAESPGEGKGSVFTVELKPLNQA